MSEHADEETRALAMLPPEPWGWRIKRGREFAAMTLDDVVAAVGAYMLTSTATISRMEDSVDEPKDPRRRALAFLASRAYGLDPEQFGVSVDDLPAAVADAIRRTEAGPRGRGRPSAFVPESVDPQAAENAVRATGSTIHFRRNPGGSRRETRRAA